MLWGDSAGPRKDDILQWCKRKTPQRDIGGYSSSPVFEATQHCLSLYNWHPSSHHSSSRAQDVYLSASLCASSFKSMPGFPVAFFLTRAESLLISTTRGYVGSSSQHGVETPHSSGCWDNPSIFSTVLIWVWSQLVSFFIFSYQSQCGFFCISLIIRFLCS